MTDPLLPKILSKRAWLFLDKPIHLISNEDTLKECWKFGIEGDKILTLRFYINSNKTQVEKIFLESLACLCEGRSVSYLIGLTFREMENFLRDENHLPVFEGDIDLATSLFFESKLDLIAAVLLEKMPALFIESAPFSLEKLNYVKKINCFTDVVAALNSQFPSSPPMKLVHLEEQNIMIMKGNFPVELLAIEKLLNKIFIDGKTNSSFKVVAVQ